MRKALEQALKSPCYPFGAVIVNRDSGVIVAEGYNQSSANPVLHGEIVAINQCAALHKPKDWRGLDLYTTAEPCPMCQSAIIWAGIGRVYYGASIPYLQALGWWQIDLRAQALIALATFRKVEIIGGILEQECNALYTSPPQKL